MKVAQLLAVANEKPATFREWFSLMVKWEVEVDKDGHIKDENLNDGQGRTYAGLTSQSDALPVTGIPSANFVVETYYQKYWIPFSLLPNRVGQITANYALNMGRGAAVKLLQNALGVTVDGLLGKITTSAAWQADQQDLCRKLIDLGRARYEAIGAREDRSRFLTGWLNRNRDVAEKFA